MMMIVSVDRAVDAAASGLGLCEGVRSCVPDGVTVGSCVTDAE